MKSSILLSAGLATVVVVAGCDQKKPEPKPTAKTTATTPAKPATSVASAKDMKFTDEELAVPEDFIEEATKEVTKDNYKEKLDELAKEIDTAKE